MQICPLEAPSRPRVPTIVEVKRKLRLGHDESCNCCCCSTCIPETSSFYKYVQPEKPKSFAPIRSYRRPEVPIDDKTTYGLSFWEGPLDPAKPIYPEHCLGVADGRITDETTNKLSYLGNWCIEPESPTYPCRRQWLGQGPMDDLTIQKQDFTWKYAKPVDPIHQGLNIYCPCAALSDDTTYRMSYFEEPCPKPRKSFKPLHEYIKSDIPLDGCTTYRLSFWPTESRVKEELPWNPKKYYRSPETPIEDHTTYRLSYFPPGSLVPIRPMLECVPATAVPCGSC